MTRFAEKDTAITGVGMSEVSRGATKSALALTVDAADVAPGEGNEAVFR